MDAEATTVASSAVRRAALAILVALTAAIVGVAPAPAGADTASAGAPRALRPDPVVLRGTGVDDPSTAAAVTPTRRAPDGPRALAVASPSTIEVTYTGFTPEAQAAFQRAVDLWEPAISSPVTIKIDADYTDLSGYGSGVLGAAGPTFLYHGTEFTGEPISDRWYPIALANALHGSDLDSATADISASFNSTGVSWHFGTGTPPSGHYDFTTVVLHEIGHGLGFTGSMQVRGDGTGCWDCYCGLAWDEICSGAAPYAFDGFAEENGGADLITAINGSPALASKLQSGSLWWSGPVAKAAAGGTRPRLFAPTTWEDGSSFAHLNENTYVTSEGSRDGLLTPYLSPREVIHEAGPIALGIFEDMGWRAALPSAPTGVAASPGDTTATVSFTPPSDEGGSVVETYRVTASPGGTTVTGTASPITVPGLTNGTAYTFKVQAENDYGGGPLSASTSPITPNPPLSGYWALGEDGAVFSFGDATNLGSPGPLLGTAKAVDIEPRPEGDGYWIVDDRGRVFRYGGAGFHGQLPGGTLAAGETATSLSATPAGDGYWIFTSRGRAFAFGAAQHFGDLSGVALNAPVLDSTTAPDGQGYFMVAADGGVFTFPAGKPLFRGSTGGIRLNEPVQSLVPDPDGVGYWLVASDGGVFAFDAGFRGSIPAVLQPGQRLNKPITGMVAYGDGYLMVAEDGGVFVFSNRPFSGSLGSNPPARPITSVAAFGPA